MTFSFFPWWGYRMIPTKHEIFVLSLHRLMQGDSHKTWHFQSFPTGGYRVISTKHDIFNLSLQVDTGWFPQNMTFSIFPCRGLQCDSHKTWHFQSFPAGWYLVIPTKHDIFNLSHAGWYRVIPKKHDIIILSLHRLIQGDSHKTWRFHSFPADGYRVIPTKHDIFILSLHRLMQGDSHKTWHFHSFPSQVDTGWFPENMKFSFFPFTGWYRVIPAKHDILMFSLQVETG